MTKTSSFLQYSSVYLISNCISIYILEDEINSKQAEVSGLKITVAELTSASAGTEARLKTSEASLENAKTRITELESLTAMQSSNIETYQDKQRSYETERRKLHNTILELKGNIRVFCRVRPLLPEEHANRSGSKSNIGNIPHISFLGEKSLEISRCSGNFHHHRRAD